MPLRGGGLFLLRKGEAFSGPDGRGVRPTLGVLDVKGGVAGRNLPGGFLRHEGLKDLVAQHPHEDFGVIDELLQLALLEVVALLAKVQVHPGNAVGDAGPVGQGTLDAPAGRSIHEKNVDAFAVSGHVLFPPVPVFVIAGSIIADNGAGFNAFCKNVEAARRQGKGRREKIRLDGGRRAVV